MTNALPVLWQMALLRVLATDPFNQLISPTHVDTGAQAYSALIAKCQSKYTIIFSIWTHKGEKVSQKAPWNSGGRSTTGNSKVVVFRNPYFARFWC